MGNYATLHRLADLSVRHPRPSTIAYRKTDKDEEEEEYRRYIIAADSALQLFWISVLCLSPFTITSTLMVVRYQHYLSDTNLALAAIVPGCLLFTSLVLIIAFLSVNCCCPCLKTSRSVDNCIKWTVWTVVIVGVLAAGSSIALSRRVGMLPPHDPNQDRYYRPGEPRPTISPAVANAPPYEFYAWYTAAAIILPIIFVLAVCFVCGNCCCTMCDKADYPPSPPSVVHVVAMPPSLTTIVVQPVERSVTNFSVQSSDDLIVGDVRS